MITHYYGEKAISEATPHKKVIIAPHADDEVLGCGGLLARYPDDCAVIVLARPDEVRMKEFQVAKEILNYSTAFILDFEDGRVGEDPRLLTTLLDRFMLQLRPEEVYLPFPSMHQDHISTYEAGIRTSRLSMGSNHWFPRNIFVYDVVAYDVNLYATDLRWNIFQSLSEEQIDKKVEALKMYSSQLIEGPHPVNGVKEIAAALGASRQVAFAEQFALVRGVRL